MNFEKERTKRISAIALSMLFFVPVVVFAASMRVEKDNLVISSSETVNNDVYALSGTVSVDGKIVGDLVAAGGQVVVSGEVSQDVLVAGGQVTISGKINDDVRLVGGTLTISGEIQGDLVIAGGSVDIQKNAKVLGDVKLGSGQAIISGETGSVDVAVGSIILSPTAKINGDFVYLSESDAKIESGANITGGTVHNKPQAEQKDFVSMYIGPKVASMLMVLVAVLFFYKVFPNKSQKISQEVKESFWKNILFGLGFFVLAPVVLLLMLVTVLGAPLALSGAAIYGVLLYVGKVFAIITLASIIKSIIEKDGTDQNLSWILIILSVLVYYFVKLIPVFGWASVTVLYLASLGATVKFYSRLTKKLRADKVI